MAGRRVFLQGLLAAGLCPAPVWADAGAPAYLAAAKRPDGSYALYGLKEDGATTFELPLPGRGHAAAAHPVRPVAVAPARRPGTFALVIDCVSGARIARLDSPEGHHFTGHAAFSGDGERLFTAENDFANNRGMVGVWDVAAGYRRIGAFPTGGVGPHELRLMPDGETLIVANGGIETHPDSGRAKLNIPVMRPNLSYLSLDGEMQEQVAPPAEWHKLSLRHISIRADGLVAVAGQWEGDMGEVPPLLAIHRRGEAAAFHDSGMGLERMMQGYGGSIAFSGDGTRIAVTGPRGGMALIFDADGRYRARQVEPDICGVAAHRDGFVFTTGHGRVMCPERRGTRAGVQWDNHLVSLSA